MIKYVSFKIEMYGLCCLPYVVVRVRVLMIVLCVPLGDHSVLCFVFCCIGVSTNKLMCVSCLLCVFDCV